MSRIVAILFHHTPPRKPVIRRRFNLKASAHSARTPNLGFELSYHSHLWARSEGHDTRVSDEWTPMSSLKASVCNSVQTEGAESMHSVWQNADNCRVMETPEPVGCPSGGLLPTSTTPGHLPRTCEASAIELAHLEQQRCREFSQPSHMPQVPESPNQTYPSCFVSNFQEEQPLQPQPVPITAYHAATYQQQPSVAVSPVAYEQLFHRSQFNPDAIAFPQHQHTLDVPDQLMADPRPPSRAQELCANRASQARFFEDAPVLVPSTPPCPYAPPVLEGLSAWPASHSQDVLSSTSPHTVESAKAAVCTPNWISHQSPISTGPSPQPYVPPFQGLRVTETFTFNVFPHTMTPHFDFSHHVPLAIAPYPCDPKPMSTRDTSLDTNHAWQSVAVEHPSMQPFDQNIHPPQMPSAQSFAQSQEAIPQTVSATGVTTVTTPSDTTTATLGMDAADAEMDANSDDDSSSDSESDTGMDSDEDDDSDTDSDDSDEGAATDTSPIAQSSARINLDKNKVPSPASGVQARSLDASNIPNRGPSSTAPEETKGKDDTDEDSDGDSEYIPPPPDKSKLADNGSSSDSGMGEYEEVEKLYREQFYASRDQR
jgi:hypothetical protein